MESGGLGGDVGGAAAAGGGGMGAGSGMFGTGSGKGHPNDMDKLAMMMEKMGKQPPTRDFAPSMSQAHMMQPSPTAGTYQPSFAQLFKQRQGYQPR